MNETDYQQIRQRVEKRHNERIGLWVHTFGFVVINTLIWIIGFNTPPAIRAIPWVVTLVWGLGLFIHALLYWTKHGGYAQHREESIQREVRHEIERLGNEKPKRNRLEISNEDASELVYEEDKQARRGERKRG